MDFYAQAYNSRPEASHTPHSSRAVHEGACQGYGTERNAHLRRASSGLELDVPRLQQLSPSPSPGHGVSSYAGSATHRQHHQNYTGGHPTSPTTANKVTVISPGVHHHHGKDGSYFSSGKTPGHPSEGAQERDQSLAKSPELDHSNSERTSGWSSSSSSSSSRPEQHRRQSVTNPCLLHHTNSNGGVVRPPVMPQSLSSSNLRGTSSSAPSTPKHETKPSSSGQQPTIIEGAEARS